MGKFVNNGIVSIPAEHSFGSQNDILEELGGLLNVGRRTDGKFYLADICQAENIKMWSKYKPEDIDKESNIDDGNRLNNGYSIGIVLKEDYFCQFPIFRIESIDYIKPSKWNRIRDFNGYTITPKNPFEWGKSEYLISDTWLVPYLINNDSNSVPLNKVSLQKMMIKGSSQYPELSSLEEIGKLFISYSGFVRDVYPLDSSDVTTLIANLRDNASGNIFRFSAPSLFSLEPKGREGNVIFYGKQGENYYQLLPPIKAINSGLVNGISIEGWTPSMALRTLSNGINNAMIVKDLINNDSVLSFYNDDELYFGFSVKGSPSEGASSGSVQMLIRITYTNYAGTKYTADLQNIFYDTANPPTSTQLVYWSVTGTGTLGPYSHTGKYGLSTAVKFPRFAIKPKGIIEALSKVHGIDIPQGSPFEARLIIKYASKNNEYLSSPFTIKMQWLNKNIVEDLIPDYIKPVPPAWDQERNI